MPIRLFQAAFGFVFEKFIERSENEARSAGVNTHVKIDFVIEEMCVALSDHAKGAAIDVKIRGADNAIFDCERHIRFPRHAITHARHDLVENVRKRAKERDGKDVTIADFHLAFAVHCSRVAPGPHPLIVTVH